MHTTILLLRTVPTNLKTFTITQYSRHYRGISTVYSNMYCYFFVTLCTTTTIALQGPLYDDQHLRYTTLIILLTLNFFLDTDLIKNPNIVIQSPQCH